jgi:ABC-type transport system involved in cytochrome c biogenesis permease subunit
VEGLRASSRGQAGLLRVNGLLFFGLCAAAVISFGLGAAGFSQGDPSAILGFAIALLALAVLAFMLRNAAQRARKSLRALPAVIVRQQERSVVRSSARPLLAAVDPALWATSVVIDAAQGTNPRATIELYDGKRLDLALVDAIERTVEPGDLGIAYVAAGYLVDFARVEG